jgi:regulatory protein
MKITSIKQQVKNPERLSIFVDGKYEFSLSLDELVKYKLKNNQEFDKGDLKKFKKISEDGKLRMRSLEWLLNRPHSEREFRDYLYRKKAEPEQIDSLIGEFTDKGYLDNDKFAKWFTELQARRGKSDRAIRAELFKKGIGREIADEAVPENAGDEVVRLRSMIEKKRKLSRYKRDPQKLMQYLVGKGFSWQQVKEQLTSDQPEKNT